MATITTTSDYGTVTEEETAVMAVDRVTKEQFEYPIGKRPACSPRGNDFDIAGIKREVVDFQAAPRTGKAADELAALPASHPLKKAMAKNEAAKAKAQQQ